MQGFNKQFKITFLVLVIVFGLIFIWNVIRNYIVARSIASNKPVATVSTAKVQAGRWHPRLFAVGTLTAINGTAISTQQAGNIVSINFNSGQRVKQGDLLIQIDDRVEQAQLQQNIAAMKLAEITYLRNKDLVEKGAVSKQAFDQATAQYQEAVANVAQTQASINYKHITAPFDGKTGIRNVSLGQYVKPGDNIVSLEALDPLYVNFYLPEKFLHQLYINQPITLQVDAAPNRTFRGKINALNSLVDTQTHNITVQATVPNKDEKLYPGLYARIEVILPAKDHVISIPQTAINYTLYGDTVYVITKDGKDDDGKDILTVSLREVDTGEQHDNKVIITDGLKVGEEVVTSGQLKLSNGQRVTINNSVQP